MAVNLSPVGGVAGQFFDNNGDPLVGGKLYTYAAGTTTPQVTYTSSSGATPNSNPIILNAGGRVPSEIWLTDGLVYKFVLYSSTDQLIGSWDNIVGINSNFVNFVTSEEVQIATAGQTVFTLTTMSYQPGINNLVVYVDGVNQVEGGSYSFVETNSTTVTFTAGLHLGAVVKFVSAETLTTIGSNAAVIAYEPAGSGAVTTTVQAKLRETVSVKDFGAVGDGVTDDTAAIQAALNSGAHEVIFQGELLYTATISVTNSVKIVNRGTLKYGGTYAASNPHFLVTADNVVFTGGIFDGNNDIGSIIQFNVGADYGNVHDCLFRNLESKTALGAATGDFACVTMKGNYGQVHDCTFEDCVNTDPAVTNDSFPRAVTITGDYNTVADIKTKNVRCPIITTGDYNHIKNVLMDTVLDNGLYYGGNYNTADGLVMVNMRDEPIVYSGSNNAVKNVTIDNSELDNALNSIGFESATNAILDGLEVKGLLKCGSLFKNRISNTVSSAVIKNINASISSVFGVYEGTVGSMSADFIDCNIEYVKQTGRDYNYFIRIDSGSANANGCRFTLSDLSGYTSSGDTFNTGLNLVLDTSFIQNSGSNFRELGTTPRFTSSRQDNINTIKSLLITNAPREFWSSQVPSTGTWNVGDTVWNSAPTAGGTIGWVCVTAGTPGTWKTFGSIAA